MIKSVIFKVLLLLSVVFILGCPMSNDGEAKPNPEPEPTPQPEPEPVVIDPVSAVNVVLENRIVTVSWEYDKEVTSFSIYRVEGETETLLEENLIEKVFEDKTFNYDVDFSYKVKVVSGENSSVFSVASDTLRINKIDLYVKNITASKLEYTQKIKVTWDPVRSANGFKIYRYISKNDTEPVIFTSNVNVFEDSDILVDTPYFYKVHWVLNGVEYGQDKEWAFGISSSNVDIYEDNNSIDALPDTSSIFDKDNQPIIYSFSDGDNLRLNDVDYYYSRGVSGIKFVKIDIITAPEGVLKVDVIQNGVTQFTNDLNQGENIFQTTFDDFYFKVYSVGNTDFITKYSVNISNSF